MTRKVVSNVVGVLLLAAIVAAGALILLRDDNSAPRIVLSPVGLDVPLSLRQAPALYPPDDPWKGYLAPERTCPGGESTEAPLTAQRRTMICLLNYARGRHGLPPLPESPLLSRAALLKAQDIYRCSDFAHGACGREPNFAASSVGYSGRAWGENLYAGPLQLGSPRVATDRWLNSPGHRVNLFRSQWDEQGIAVLRVRSFEGQPNVAIWVSQFGAVQ